MKFLIRFFLLGRLEPIIFLPLLLLRSVYLSTCLNSSFHGFLNLVVVRNSEMSNNWKEHILHLFPKYVSCRGAIFLENFAESCH